MIYRKKYPSQLLIILVLIYFISCSKKDTDIPVATEVYLEINGIEDVYIAANSSDTMLLSVVQSSGSGEDVTITTTGLPDKVISNFSRASGLVSFMSLLTISSDYATVGTYPVTIIATTSSGKVKTYSFNLTITPYIDCASMSGLTKNSTSSVCCYGEKDHTATGEFEIRNDSSRPNGLLLALPTTFPEKLPITLDCNTGNVIVPPYHHISDSVSVTITGEGTFTKHTFTLTLYTTKERAGQKQTFYCTYNTFRL